MVGFGASGRNGGWVSGFFSGPARAYERRAGRAGFTRRCSGRCSRRSRRSAQVIAEHAIDADFVKGGQPARGARATPRSRTCASTSPSARAHGPRRGGSARARPRGARRAHRGAGARGGDLLPARRARAPRQARRRASPAAWSASAWRSTSARPSARSARGAALTPAGAVRARWVVRATEGYTASLRGLRRALVPMNSSMIVTEPLGADVWREIGWEGREVLGDGAHVYVYLQRTADGRIAIGGRGVPYRFGSRTDGRGETAARDGREPARQARRRCSPRPLARPSSTPGRACSACRATGASRSTPTPLRGSPGRAATSARAWPPQTSLGGRCATCCSGERSELVGLPWVGRRPRQLGARAAALGRDPRRLRALPPGRRLEARSGRPSRLGRLVDAASGRA